MTIAFLEQRSHRTVVVGAGDSALCALFLSIAFQRRCTKADITPSVEVNVKNVPICAALAVRNSLPAMVGMSLMLPGKR
jgi:hypothetical protein